VARNFSYDELSWLWTWSVSMFGDGARCRQVDAGAVTEGRSGTVELVGVGLRREVPPGGLFKFAARLARVNRTSSWKRIVCG
jgi:hypothetical protein